MREIRSYGSVGGLGREAQVYPENRGNAEVDSDPDSDSDLDESKPQPAAVGG